MNSEVSRDLHSSLPPLTSVSFEDKLQFSASQRLSVSRSKWFKLPESESDSWCIKPPDFSVKLYKSSCDPQEKRSKRHSNLAVPQLTERKRKTGAFLPEILLESHRREDPPKFITSFRPPDALESELMFVRSGKFLSGPYENPKPHDFRPLDEDLPDIITTYDRDPGNLKMKLKHLDIVGASRAEPDLRLGGSRTWMDTYKPAEPRWDARLVLQQELWPPRSASYTRHRRRRDAYSAFLDRVEEKLTRTWKKGTGQCLD